VSYTSNSLFVGELEYPFPSGLYLTRVVELSRRTRTSAASAADPLLELLTDTHSMGNKYGKEISEAMAMADAVQRAASLLPASLRKVLRSDQSVEGGTKEGGASTEGEGVAQRVVVYVLGDGCRPLTAASLCLQLPAHVVFHSIDPLMQEKYVSAGPAADVAWDGSENPLGAYQHRFFPARMYSQDFQIPPSTTREHGAEPSALSIVVSCHSHAPLQEFWDRVPMPRIAVTMACCAGYADLAATPTLQFEDFEVYSPKRTVKIYLDV
jgi:hypothetical protein